MKLLDIIDATPFPIGYRIAFITNFLREPILRRMERELGIIRPELTVLMCTCFREDVHARDICEVTEQPSNTISRAVSSLEKKGHLSRKEDQFDTRKQVLNITPSGKEVHDKVMVMFTESEDAMLAGLSEMEKAQLLALLDKIARNVPRWRP
ncbi:MAG: MarR family winged helix-turn-helix transcriptional regulator [Pseudomonadota bacterium]